MKKSNSSEPGYIYVPYIMQQKTSIIDGVGFWRKISRKRKIETIFGLPISESSNKSLSSRYSSTKVNSNNYMTLKVEDPSI